MAADSRRRGIVSYLLFASYVNIIEASNFPHFTASPTWALMAPLFVIHVLVIIVFIALVLVSHRPCKVVPVVTGKQLVTTAGAKLLALWTVRTLVI